MKRDPVVIIVVAMVVSLMLVFGFHMARRSQGTASAVGNMKGQPAPEFALQSLDGKTIHLSDFRGKAVLLNFWATWCEPCKIEMPWFVELQKEYGPEGLQIVGVAMDDASAQDIAKFAQNLGVNYPILIGKKRWATPMAASSSCRQPSTSIARAESWTRSSVSKDAAKSKTT